MGAKETHPDILCGGHRNPLPIEKCNKSWRDSFLHISLGLSSLPVYERFHLLLLSIKDSIFPIHMIRKFCYKANKR